MSFEATDLESVAVGIGTLAPRPVKVVEPMELVTRVAALRRAAAPKH